MCEKQRFRVSTVNAGGFPLLEIIFGEVAYEIEDGSPQGEFSHEQA